MCGCDVFLKIESVLSRIVHPAGQAHVPGSLYLQLAAVLSREKRRFLCSYYLTLEMVRCSLACPLPFCGVQHMHLYIESHTQAAERLTAEDPSCNTASRAQFALFTSLQLLGDMNKKTGAINSWKPVGERLGPISAAASAEFRPVVY